MKRTLLTPIAATVIATAAPNAIADSLVAESGVDFAFDPSALALVERQVEAPVATQGAPDDAATDASLDESLQTNATRIRETFGAKGSMRWTIRGGYGFHAGDSDNWYVQGGLGLSYFVLDGFSFNAELNGAYYNERGDNAGGIGLDLLVRWHFINERTWSIYADAGAGILGTTADVPSNGSSFNFTPQAGVGATFAVGDSDTRVMLGVRWVHISNAGLYDDNPGRDNIMGYVGLTIPF